jgi:Gram-negative bacterial TonB protein C-terminal
MTNTTFFRLVLEAVTRVLAALLMLSPTFAQGANPAKPSAPPFTLNVELLTDPDGIDLSPYVKGVFKAVKDKALATMPPSVAKGDQGVVKIRLWIQKDGTLAAPAPPSLMFSSRKKVLDEHAMDAVIKAAPYEHLPEKLHASSIELRLTFYYNIVAPQ